jgi:hypothetical protein
MKRYGRINEILDQALRRLGTPPRDDLEAARERIRENLRNMNPAEMPPPSFADTKPLRLWGLRQPFLIAGVVIAAALSAATFWILSVRSPSENVSTALEPARSGSAPPINQNDREALPPPQSNEVPVRQGKAIKRPAPKRLVEEAKPPEAPPAIADVPATDPGAIPTPESVLVQPDADPGRAVLDRVCTVCHSLRGIEKHIFSSPDAYKDLVSEMISRGAVVSDEEMATIAEYLYRMYGQK